METILRNVKVSIILISSDEKVRILLKKFCDWWNCQEMIKLIRVTKLITAGIINNCWWVAN